VAGRLTLYSLLVWASACSRSAETGASIAEDFALAVEQHQAGDLESALGAYDRVLGADPQHLGAWINCSALRLEQGEWEAALADADHALELNPEDADAHLQRARILFAGGTPEAALVDLGRALELDPLLDGAYETRGDCWVELNELDAAVVDYSNALRLDPNRVELWTSRAEAQRARQQPDEAAMDDLLAELTQRILRSEGDPEGYVTRGLALLERQETELAQTDFDRALAIDPKLERAFLARAHTRWLLGEEAQALADYGAWIQDHPGARGPALLARATVYTLLGSDAEAAADLEQALTDDPMNHAARADLAWLLATSQVADAQNPARGLELAEALPADSEEPWRPSEIRAAAYAALGRWEEAEGTLGQAIQAAPEEVATKLRDRLTEYRAR